MKKFLSTALIAIVSLSTGQALALTPENTTKHKIETNYIDEKVLDEEMKGYAITIDGIPVLQGEAYVMMTQLREPLSTMLEVAKAPLLAPSVSKIEFSISEVCPGSADGDVIQAVITDGEETEMFCFSKEEEGKIYAIFPFGGF